ncbi:MAG: YggU family protein [Candidatus Magasanikbacteria bacterium CG10_big_fil_rev_8_21_14_0_10_36_32]|uniref:UPF0235 protein COU29_02155 n=1 Tax=Candidatus Magasanikbacteria bacterium CG10_big_fil_rev_8_21_14_0_10_36_32 TaxID=1974646 RepID=A0A2M6W706_9BACT|nr:MAG: YggU family protein [Candidatus Magasanikbacteria bacterium CG10_big_fil_rev_8_21_14_0_10_36_32]
MLLRVRVSPRASKNEIIGPVADGTIKIKLKAPPVDGKANRELIKFLSREYNTPKTKIEIIKGLNGKNKTIKIN